MLDVDDDSEDRSTIRLGREERARNRVLVVSRIHVSRMGAEIWKVTESSHPYSGEAHFESGNKDAVVERVALSLPEAKFVQDPRTHQLIPWPDDTAAARELLNQWIERPQGSMYGDSIAGDWHP